MATSGYCGGERTPPIELNALPGEGPPIERRGAAPLPSAGRALAGVNAGPCPGTTRSGQCQDPLALAAQGVGVGTVRVLQRAMVRPPQVGEHDHALGCADQNAQVLGV